MTYDSQAPALKVHEPMCVLYCIQCDARARLSHSLLRRIGLLWVMLNEVRLFQFKFHANKIVALGGMRGGEWDGQPKMMLLTNIW